MARGLKPIGSSPRLRGTRLDHVCVNAEARFIPAFAGNAADRQEVDERMAVHPRVCGERYAADSTGGETIGSSPRLRGTLTHALWLLAQHRFIPAFAGNAPRGCAP